jgi:hypothetical protein
MPPKNSPTCRRMDPQTKNDLRELPRLSQQVLNNLNDTMRELARVNLNSPEFNEVLRKSRKANNDADELLKKQRAVIRAIRG